MIAAPPASVVAGSSFQVAVAAEDRDGNVDPSFKDNHYLEPIPVADSASAGYVDRWVVYGRIDGEQLFTAKELTVNPGVKVTVKDNGAYGLVAVQGTGKIGKHALQTPAMIDFGELTEDEYFVTDEAARQGVTFENSGTEPLVTLRYFGPEVTEPIRLHVDAKRYLCAVDPPYLDGLSPASRLSLKLQGGPMDPAEVAAFEANAYCRDAVRLRRWDDTAKVPGLAVPGPSHYRGRLEAAVAGAAWPTETGPASERSS